MRKMQVSRFKSYIYPPTLISEYVREKTNKARKLSEFKFWPFSVYF